MNLYIGVAIGLTIIFAFFVGSGMLQCYLDRRAWDKNINSLLLPDCAPITRAQVDQKACELMERLKEQFNATIDHNAPKTVMKGDRCFMVCELQTR